MKKIFGLIFLTLLFTSQTNALKEDIHNVTLNLELENVDKIYIDGEEKTEGTYTNLELPYIVSEQPLGIISYSNFNSLEYRSKSSEIFSVTQSSNSFIVPNTKGGYAAIEDQRESLLSQEFLSSTEPSFYYPEISENNVKIFLNPSVEIKSTENLRGKQELSLRNSGGSLEIY